MRDMELRRLQKLEKKDERYEAMKAAELMIWNRGRNPYLSEFEETP